jgi:hypothetical protein
MVARARSPTTDIDPPHWREECSAFPDVALALPLALAAVPTAAPAPVRDEQRFSAATAS